MKDWFDRLEARERLTVVAGAVLLGLTLVWVLLISPLYVSAGNQGESITALQNNVVRARQLVSDIQRMTAAGSKPVNNQPLIITLERTAQEAGLQVNQSRPMNESTVRVTFESASFDALVRWMGVLENQHGIHIDIASRDRLDIPGLVDAQLTVKRPG